MKQSVDFFESGKIYHVFSRAIGTEMLFKEPENYRFFLEKFDLYNSQALETLAYCLIPNHFHFLVRVNENASNSEAVKSFSDFLNSYTKAYNKSSERNGGLFQRKFKRKLISDEDYLTRIVIYIHLNPVKHCVTDDYSLWNYSSYKAYLSEKPSKIKRNLALEWFGGQEEFKRFHLLNLEEYIPEDLKID